MFPLHPETPEEGRSLEELFNASPAAIEQMVAGLKNRAESLGLPFGKRTKTYNSRLAQELGLWAESEGKGHLFHKAAFEEYFVSSRNIYEQEVLLDICKKSGLHLGRAEQVLTSRSYSDAVDKDWQLAKENRITAVPTFCMGKSVLVGAQQHQTLREMILKNGQQPQQAQL